MDNKITIEKYHPDWTDRFNELKTALENEVTHLFLTIEHVGSTSVPGLSAKPIIDLDIVIEHIDLLPLVIKELEKLGYYSEGDLGIGGREAFARSDESVPWTQNPGRWMEHHLYVCSKDSSELKRHLTFRNYLRKNPEVACKYESVKKALAASAIDRAAYTEGKANFIQSVLAKALKNDE